MKGRLIISGITSIITFFVLLGITSFEVSLLVGLGIFVFFMVLSSPEFQEWDRRRVERIREEDEITRIARAEERGRQQAQREAREAEEAKKRFGKHGFSGAHTLGRPGYLTKGGKLKSDVFKDVQKSRKKKKRRDYL